MTERAYQPHINSEDNCCCFSPWKLSNVSKSITKSFGSTVPSNCFFVLTISAKLFMSSTISCLDLDVFGSPKYLRFRNLTRMRLWRLYCSKPTTPLDINPYKGWVVGGLSTNSSHSWEESPGIHHEVRHSTLDIKNDLKRTNPAGRRTHQISPKVTLWLHVFKNRFPHTSKLHFTPQLAAETRPASQTQTPRLVQRPLLLPIKS